MLFAVLALIAAHQTPWDAAPSASVEAAAAAHGVPEWGVADPFGYERARCSALLRGDTSLEDCQAKVRGQLAMALGDRLPEALRPEGMAGACQMIQAGGGGSAYAVTCVAPPRDVADKSPPVEQDCRSRPEGGGFTSACRPVGADRRKGIVIRLWGADN